MPKVSVIVPVYGVEKYIERCARSLFEQTLDDIEYIFVDDCTPDRSIDILKALIEEYRLRFAEMNYQVRIERMPTNSGLPAVRRHGIQLATGDYIIHCDSDDWVDRDMYRQMYEKAVGDDADIVVCDYYSSDSVNKSITKGLKSKIKTRILSDFILQEMPLAVWNKMIKKSLYSNPINYPNNNMGEDMVLVIQLIYYSSNISYVECPLYYYFNNSSSITRNGSRDNIIKKFNQAIENTSMACAFLERNGLNKNYPKEMVIFKLKEKNFILPLIGERKYYDVWKSTFSEVNIKLFFSPFIPFLQKIKYILIFCRLRNSL